MSDRDKLHAAIMNLPCGIKGELWPNILHAYRSGHRDARHAAAELVSAAWSARDSEVERLREALKELYEAASAEFPPASEGMEAQTAWAARKANAFHSARILLSSQDKESA